MRKTTVRKTYGRSNMAQSLRSAVQELNSLIPELEKESSLEILIGKVQTVLKRAVEYHDIYKMNRKRIRTAIEREIDNLNALLQEVVGLPITPEEKVLAKHKEVKAHDKRKTKTSLGANKDKLDKGNIGYLFNTTVHQESPGAEGGGSASRKTGNTKPEKPRTDSKQRKQPGTGKVTVGIGGQSSSRKARTDRKRPDTKRRPGKMGRSDLRGRAPGRLRQPGGTKGGVKKSRVPVSSH